MKLFADGLRFCMGEQLSSDAVSFFDMLADDAVMEFPYAPTNFPRRLDGKAAIQSYMEGVGSRLRIDLFTSPVIHRTATGYVLETRCEGVALQTGKPYLQDYISVITLRDGHIVHYRDYWNPLITLAAFSPDPQTENGHN